MRMSTKITNCLLLLAALLAGTGSVLGQSTDINHPTPLASNAISGSGDGSSVEYFFTFDCGPGEFTATLEAHSSKMPAGGSIMIELIDPKNEIFGGTATIALNSQKLGEVFQTSRNVLALRKGSMVLKIKLTKAVADYSIRLTGAVEFAPSTERDHPAPLMSNTVEGEGDGQAATYYYTFWAGPGPLKVTVDGTTDHYSSTIQVRFTDEGGRPLLDLPVIANSPTTRETGERNFLRRQRVIMSISLRDDPQMKWLKYRIKLEGAVQWEN